MADTQRYEVVATLALFMLEP